jgi:hypothetical protein
MTPILTYILIAPYQFFHLMNPPFYDLMAEFGWEFLLFDSQTLAV